MTLSPAQERARNLRDLRICAMIDSGAKYAEITAAEGVSASTVSAFVKVLREVDAEAAE